MMFDFALIFGVAIAFVLFLLKGPGMVLDFCIMCLSDKVVLINLTAATIAYNLNILSKVSFMASLISPIVICASAFVVLMYNVVKFVNATKNKEE